MSFLQPIWLWGLLSLSLPLAIHLFSRKPPKAHPVGSLKPFLSRVSKNPKRPKLDRPWLLLLRMAILAAFFIWLADPAVKQRPLEKEKQLVLLHPSIPQEQQAKFLGRETYELRWLQKGLPRQIKKEQSTPSIHLWELLAEADGLDGIKDTIWVVSPMRQEWFGKQRPALAHAVVWLPYADRSGSYSDDSAYKLQLNASLQYWQEEKGDRQLPADTFTVVLAYAPEFAQDRVLLKWALEAAAIGSPHYRLEIIEQPLPAQRLPQGNVLWLSDAPPADSVWLRLNPQPEAGWLMETEKGYWLTQLPTRYRHQPAILSQLPLALSQLLPALPAENLLMMEEGQAAPLLEKEKAGKQTATQSVGSIFLIIFLMLLLLERWWILKSA